MQIAAGQTVAAGDNGDAVFNQIKNGNGTFTVSAGPANTGSGIIGATTVSDPASYGGDSYSIKFTAADTYQVTDTTTNTVVTSGAYTSGQAITFDGLQVTLSGQPADGRYLRGESEHQSEPVHHGAESRHGAAGGRPVRPPARPS